MTGDHVLMMYLAAMLRRDCSGWSPLGEDGCGFRLPVDGGVEFRTDAVPRDSLRGYRVDFVVSDGFECLMRDVVPDDYDGLMRCSAGEVELYCDDCDWEALADRVVLGSRGSNQAPDIQPFRGRRMRWCAEEVDRLVRLVHLNDLSVLDESEHFELRDDMDVRVYRRFGSETSADLALSAEYTFEDSFSLTFRGVPVPSSKGVTLFFGSSRLDIPVDAADIARATDGGCAERTRRYLAEHPVDPWLLKGFSDREPSFRPGHLGVVGDGREYGFPVELFVSRLWDEIPLRLMNPNHREYRNETFVCRYPSNRYPRSLGEQSLRMRPNFLFKPTGFEVVWDKLVPGKIWMNQPLTPREIMHIMVLCRQVLGDDTERFGTGCPE